MYIFYTSTTTTTDEESYKSPDNRYEVPYTYLEGVYTFSGYNPPSDISVTADMIQMYNAGYLSGCYHASKVSTKPFHVVYKYELIDKYEWLYNEGKRDALKELRPEFTEVIFKYKEECINV